MKKRLTEEFQLHDTLNPALWDTETNTLLPEVHDKIVEIVTTFEDYIDCPIEIVDIQLVGSNASYNWNPTSDLDVHIVSNFELVSPDTEILQSLYNTKKSNFNSTYDISIHGVEIEIYVQDIKSGIHSNGIYSVCENKWVKEPQPMLEVTVHDTSKEVSRWIDKIEKILIDGSLEDVSDAINMLYLVRKNSLDVDGETGKGNQIFKDVRSAGYLQKLKDRYDELVSKKLTLESMTKGQIVNRL